MLLNLGWGTLNALIREPCHALHHADNTGAEKPHQQNTVTPKTDKPGVEGMDILIHL